MAACRTREVESDRWESKFKRQRVEPWKGDPALVAALAEYTILRMFAATDYVNKGDTKRKEINKEMSNKNEY